MRIMLFAVIFLSYVVTASAEVTDAMRKQFVDTHNGIRKEAGRTPLRWSAALAQDAQNWANTLKAKGGKMRHAKNLRKLKQGENLFMKSAARVARGKDENGKRRWQRKVAKLSVRGAVNSWGKEKRYLNMKNNKCQKGKVCGHYKQIIRKNIAYVGCGHVVNKNKSQLIVCRYGK